MVTIVKQIEWNRGCLVVVGLAGEVHPEANGVFVFDSVL